MLVLSNGPARSRALQLTLCFDVFVSYYYRIALEMGIWTLHVDAGESGKVYQFETASNSVLETVSKETASNRVAFSAT